MFTSEVLQLMSAFGSFLLILITTIVAILKKQEK